MTMENKQQLNEQELGKASGGSVVATVGAVVTAAEVAKEVIDALKGNKDQTTTTTTPAAPTNTINNQGNNNKNVIVNGDNAGGISM